MHHSKLVFMSVENGPLCSKNFSGVYHKSFHNTWIKWTSLSYSILVDATFGSTLMLSLFYEVTSWQLNNYIL